MDLVSSTAPNGIKKYIPILDWLPSYKSSWLRLDLIAGLTAAAVVIPQSLAYATQGSQIGLFRDQD